jgi:CspA family cold shock protein
VREWHDDEGWGVVDCADLEAACWVHFSVVEMTGYRRLDEGALVRCVVERAAQDGYGYRATKVIPL